VIYNQYNNAAVMMAYGHRLRTRCRGVGVDGLFSPGGVEENAGQPAGKELATLRAGAWTDYNCMIAGKSSRRKCMFGVGRCFLA